MNTRNHKAYCDLMNIGIKKSLREDIPEENRIHVHGDAVSAVWVCFDRTEESKITMTGRDEPPKNIDKVFHEHYVEPNAHEGVRACVNRERLIELLKGMGGDEVVVMLKKSDAPLMIYGYYDERVGHAGTLIEVEALLMPRIEPPE